MTDERRPGGRDLAIGVPAALVAGALVGVLGTFKHQVGISAATGTGVPVGLVLSIVMVALLLVALRLSFPARWLAAAAAIGAIAAVVLLSLPGPGGSQVILGNTAGLVWTAAPVVVGALVVGWPRVERRAPAGGQDVDGILVPDPNRQGPELP